MIDVTRSSVSPASLADGRSYAQDDVLRSLHELFFGKCYLCETPVEIGTFQVDHRRPQAHFSHLKFSWENLFPTCNVHRCNSRRPRKYPESGLLDPGQGVESRLEQAIRGGLSTGLRNSEVLTFSFRSLDPADLPAKNTADELDIIHNATDSRSQHTARALRARIQKYLQTILPTVLSYLHLLREANEDARSLKEHEQRVRELVSRRAPYSMLVRSYFQHPAVCALHD